MWLFFFEWEFHVSKIKVFNLSKSRGFSFQTHVTHKQKISTTKGHSSHSLVPTWKKNTTLVPQKFQGLTNPMASPWWTKKSKAWLTFLVEFLIILGRSPGDIHTIPFRREVVDAGLYGPIHSLKAGERAQYLRKCEKKSTENPVDFERKNESSSDFWE